MPYKVGAKGSHGCSGYPAVKTSTGEVMGCHKTKKEAAGQIYAINRSEGNIGKAMVKEGDMVMAPHEEEMYVGRVVHVMTEGMLGMPGSEYSIEASSEDPAILIQLFEMEDGELEETEYFVGAKAKDIMIMPSLELNENMDKTEVIKEDISVVGQSSNDPCIYDGCGCPTCKDMNVCCDLCPVCQANEMKGDCCGDVNKANPCWEGYVQRGMKEKNGKMVPNCVPVEKTLFEGFGKIISKTERITEIW
jgi:hypothetical protein